MTTRPGARQLCALATGVVALALWAGVDAAEATDGATSVDGQRLRTVVSVENVPSGATLDPQSLEVKVDGRRVKASARLLGKNGSAEDPQRTVVLAIDTSGSMAGEGIAQARVAARSFVRGVPGDVRVGLLSFDDRVAVLERPSTLRASVLTAIGTLQASRGNTSLYDGISRGLDLVGTIGERSLIVLSDGDDTSSRLTREQVLAELRASGIRTRFVAFRTASATTGTLRSLADGPGDVLQASDGAELADAFASVAESFDTQLVVSATLPRELVRGSHELAVRASVGEVTVDRTSTFALATENVPRSQSRSSIAPASGSGDPTFLLGTLFLVFAAIVVLVFAVLAPVRSTGSDRLRRGLAIYALTGSRAKATRADETPNRGAIAGSVLELTGRVVERRGWNDRIVLKLDRAQVPLRPNEWLVIRAAAMPASAAILLLIFPPLLAIPFGVVLGMAGSAIYLRIRAGRRLKAFADGLPDTLQLIASSLQTGFSLPQALDSVVRDGREPMSHELNRALAEARLGAPLEDALERVSDRMDSQDFRWTVMAIRIQRQVGGNLAEVLTTTVHTMRDRAALRRQVRTLSAEGRLSAYILLGLPIVLFGWLYLTRYDYISLLWTESIGLVMIVIALIGMVIGWFWMRKTVQVEA